MHLRFRSLVASLVVLGTLSGGIAQASAATRPLSKNAWIPYWKEAGGIDEASKNLSSFTSISPFGYEVQPDGKLVDKLGLGASPWTSFLRTAERRGVNIYPTVSWFNGPAIHALLSDSRKRTQHVDTIIDTVLSADRTIDGVEIDYESKLAETNPYFSLFLSELSTKLHRKNKQLVCDIEPRTPLEDRYTVVTPALSRSVAYANDYTAIGQACDEVRIMAYDQGRVALKLNRVAGGYYAPIADPAWVKRVLASTTPQIDPKKITLGIPTYGRVYRVESSGAYTQIAGISYVDALALAVKQKATVTRGPGGELTFTYFASNSGAPGATPVPSVRKNRYFVSFADATSIAGLVDLARQYKLGGVALFKVDGTSDPNYANSYFK